MNYLVANLHDITLKQMAAHFGYQPKYLSRLIKQLFNQTFTQSVGKSLLEPSFPRKERKSQANAPHPQLLLVLTVTLPWLPSLIYVWHMLKMTSVRKQKSF